MQVNGIIAEYNPFHNGHKYHLEEAKKSTGAEYTIIVMSGNFVQRGVPALLDKYRRTETALQNGADLVLELPMYYALSSAEYFATGAVTLLDKLGVVTNVCFGSECGNIDILDKISDILLEEPTTYKLTLRKNMRQGMSYPAARTSALLKYDPSLSSYLDIFSSPNNILGLEYLKALKRRNSTISPFTTQRVGADYRDKRMNEKQSSALAIRHAIFSGQNPDYLKSQMPESAYLILTDYLTHTRPLHVNDFSSALHYKLLTQSDVGFEQYLDVSADLSDRICKNLYNFEGFRNFCDYMKSKDMTYTRICRCMLHILLGMTTSTMEKYRAMDYIPYARVLGFRKDASPLLSAIKENSAIPLITKLADANQILSADSYEMLKQDIQMNQIYESAISLKSGLPMLNEYRTPIVII